MEHLKILLDASNILITEYLGINSRELSFLGLSHKTMTPTSDTFFSKDNILQIILLILLLVSFILVSNYPVLSKTYNLSLLIIIISFLVTILYLSRKVKGLFSLFLIIFLLPILFLITPSSNINTNRLHQEYIKNLTLYNNVPYHWGGENNRGIDCSGLARKAIRDALLHYSISNFNSNALLEYLHNWWYDSSAQAMSRGYKGYTFSLHIKGKIRQLDYSKLKAGDLAITQDGLHLLIFSGNESWIQADPIASKVTNTNGRIGKSQWFDNPVELFRWKYFK